MSSPRDFISRDDVVTGSIQSERRGARVLGAIEGRVLHMRDETRRAIDAYFFGRETDYQRSVDRGYVASILARARTEDELGLADVERFAAQWRSLVPGDARIRAELLRRLLDRYGPGLGSAVATLEALRASSSSVLEAYRAAFDEELALDSAATAVEAAASNDAEQAAQWLRVAAGEAIYREGDAAEALYLVINGRLHMTSADPDDETADWEFGRGDVVGEVELLTGEHRGAGVVTTRDSELIRVPRDAVLGLAREHPETLLRMNRALAGRLRARRGARRRLQETRTFALVPAHDDAEVRMVSDGLVPALAALDSTVLVDRRRLDGELPESLDLDQEAYEAAVLTWLSELETTHRHLVLEAERDPGSEWSRRCVRQADHVVVVADAATAPDASILASIGEQAIGRLDLVLVHAPDVERPRHTQGWLKALNPRFVYHWRRDDDAQAAHIARRLTGEGVGVVLSGGAARGFAHIGVMKALGERGIPVDLIAGASMGALLGAGFALGRDAADMRRRSMAMASRRKLLDPTFPLAAFTSGMKVTDLLRREMEAEQIEDLWRPYFCLSSNLTRATAQIHDHGPLWSALRASIAIPGIFPPALAANGDVLVDGGIVNNLPLDLVRHRADIGTVIGVNVVPTRDQSETHEFGPSISGWSLLLDKLRRAGGVGSAPGLASTVMRANEIRGAALMQSRSFTGLADLVIEPAVEQFPLLQFSECPSLIDSGYLGAVEAIGSWLAGDGDGFFARLGIAEEQP